MTKLYKKNQKSSHREYAKERKKDIKDIEEINKRILSGDLQALSRLWNYTNDKFHTTSKPTNYDKKIYNITELEDGSYIYEKNKDIK